MNCIVIVRDRATQDLRQQANYILATGNREAAERFLESAEYTFNQLAITPNIGKNLQLPDISAIRQWRLKNFKEYLIFYTIQEQKVEILRVLHGARDLENLIDFLD
ncbi:type II toxin-antitoxin system RelE/ParE family toxin [Pseudanabaena sp. FACHB-1998]|uniref:type II toxin-antitoxin system RelE/ParE family toxin n=1 Tax=Pseudanabaena sp. FACHB-1998 TaxID=2692858 RepID=UPI001681A6DD|nr:type II toxin-antitoxin system RelE/ParE family toxin [Pseudanabaena sp. FACHB-1998]MBD2175674.1 type II toxin-antitoxin system RelE/ParE family toxin [Pseudanabaena sp. FACHB-1998]